LIAHRSLVGPLKHRLRSSEAVTITDTQTGVKTVANNAAKLTKKATMQNRIIALTFAMIWVILLALGEGG